MLLDAQTRARKHAALGDPVRLAVVDLLALGDIAPSALGDAVGLPTNLLAHHLKVLEEAGLVRRVRSEGDRRRTYVQLVTEDPFVAAMVPAPTGETIAGAERVLFVCSQNSARSQLALAAWTARSGVPAACAGTRPAPQVHPLAVRVGRRHGLDLSGATTHNLQDVARTGDLVVAVCDNAYEELPTGAKPLHWAIPDPARVDTDAAFETAYGQISRRVETLARALDTNLPRRTA